MTRTRPRFEVGAGVAVAVMATPGSTPELKGRLRS
jgi:hypothetical protein